MSLAVTRLGPDRYEEWNKAVLASPHSTLFHTTLFLEAIKMEFDLLAIEGEGGFRGGIIIPFRRAMNGQRTPCRPQFTPYTGLTILSESKKRVTAYSDYKQITTALLEAAQSRHSELAFRMAPEIKDLQPFLWGGWTVGIRYTYLTRLSDLGDALDAMDPRRRNDLKRSEKEGIQIKRGQNVSVCLDLFKGTRSLGREAQQDLLNFDKVLQSDNRATTFCTYDKEGQLLSAAYLVWDNFRAYYLLGGYSEDERTQGHARGASSLALWEAIKYCSTDLKLQWFDFEGSMIPGVEAYFRKFGGELTPYYTARWLNPKLRAGRQFSNLIRSISNRLKLK